MYFSICYVTYRHSSRSAICIQSDFVKLLPGVGKSVLPNIDCRSAFLSGMEQPLCQGRLPEYGDDQLHRRLSYRTSSLDQKHSHRRFTIFSYSNHVTSSLSAIQDQCGSGGSGSAAEHVSVEWLPASTTTVVGQQSVLDAFNLRIIRLEQNMAVVMRAGRRRSLRHHPSARAGD